MSKWTVFTNGTVHA